jgi:uncharacterized protein YdiU (UPF0061 family)
MKIKINNHFEKLGEDFFKKALPTPLKNSRIAAYSSDVLELLDLDKNLFKDEKFLNKISGKNPDENFCYLAQAYSGHQFGHFVETLGDGRAILLAQIENHKKQSFDLVLKGSGLTPFSRPYVQNADGRAVLRSSIREFLASEALHHLGIPTSRALCLIVSDDLVMRENLEPAAQIIRVCKNHIRFGSFEYFFYRKENDRVRILANYVASCYPELVEGSSENKYTNLLKNVVTSTAKLIARWQAFGFCHGVLNTDNMSICGISFDFGPFGFLDEYNPHHICNHSDFQGRYSYINQVAIGLWNLNAFAITLSSLISMNEIKEILEKYEKIFLQEYHSLMAAKLGFSKVDEDVEKFIYQTLGLLKKHQIDYTNFFRNLENSNVILSLSKHESWKIDFKNWQESYKPDATHLIKKSNPKFILRNYLLQQAIEKAESGDFSEVKKLQKIMMKPFDEQNEFEDYANTPPAWAKKLQISCSS